MKCMLMAFPCRSAGYFKVLWINSTSYYFNSNFSWICCEVWPFHLKFSHMDWMWTGNFLHNPDISMLSIENILSMKAEISETFYLHYRRKRVHKTTDNHSQTQTSKWIKLHCTAKQHSCIILNADSHLYISVVSTY